MYVYAYQNANQETLYVGSSQHVLNRHLQHKKEKPWIVDVTSITVCGPYEKEVGLLCEKVLISKAKPRFNTNMAEEYFSQEAPILYQKGKVFTGYDEMKRYFHSQATEPKRCTFYLLAEDDEALRELSFYSGETISDIVKDLLHNAIAKRGRQLGINDTYGIARERLSKKSVSN